MRTRLTHSLEVSTVARDLAYNVANELCKEGTLATGLDYPSQISTIAATCGLIHDIGNPPFGHSGEEAIKTWFQKKIGNKGDEIDKIKNFTPQQSNDFLEFEGNAQTLRLIAKLQVLADTYGLNLTYATLSASCKYLAPSGSDYI